ncbi:hypothetical protein ACFX2I_039814 [Malus domestica]
MFASGISVGDVSWPTRNSSPGGWCRLRAAGGLLLHCRALSGKSCRARLKENDRVNFKRCLCGALGVGLEAHNQG